MGKETSQFAMKRANISLGKGPNPNTVTFLGENTAFALCTGTFGKADLSLGLFLDSPPPEMSIPGIF